MVVFGRGLFKLAGINIGRAALIVQWVGMPLLAGPDMVSADPATSGEEARSGRQLPVEEYTPFYGVVTYTLDGVSNLSGGQRTGTGYVSLLHLGGGVNGAAIGLPTGSRLEISALRIDSQDPSVKYIGDTQVASNIDAPSATRINQLWYRQDFANTPLRVWLGLIDLNHYLDVTESAGTLLNSSFGITPVISGNVPTSTYPKPGYGAMMRWETRGSALHLGVFQGNPEVRKDVFHDGRMLIAEWQPVGAGEDNNSLGIKFGAWQCHCRTGVNEGDLIRAWGGYGSLQVAVGKRGDEPIVAFLHLAGSPSRDSLSPFALAAGFSLPSPLGGRPDDLLSMGVTRMNLRDLSAETSYELTYVVELMDDIALQPDLQYITNPSGIYHDAWVFTLRLNTEFDTHF